jgi:hypothetical protein
LDGLRERGDGKALRQAVVSLANVRWRQECAAKVGLGFMIPEDQNNPLLDKSGQVFEVEIAETVSQ